MDGTSSVPRDYVDGRKTADSTDASETSCYPDRMRLLISLGASLVCGTAAAAALFRYISDNSASPNFWDSDPLAIIWSAFGGAGGVLVLAYGLFAFVLVTSYAYLDLASARARLARAASLDDDTPPDRMWRAAFADTDFRSIAGQLTPYELGAAPLALLRILRTEIWRIYAKRLLCAATVAIVLAGMVIALAPWRAGVPTGVAEGQWQAFGAVLLLVAAATTWLIMDQAINRLAMTMTRLSTAWGEAPPRESPQQDSGPTTPATRTVAVDDLIVAVERLVAALATKPSSRAGTGTATAIEALKDSLRDAADDQRHAIERLGEQLAAQHDEFARRLGEVQATAVDAAALSEAMAQLSAAVDKLADPVLRRIQLLGATDRRLLAVLRRQENMVGNVTSKWTDLVGALRAMSIGLGSFAEASERHVVDDARYAAAPAPAELGDELQELLDEITTTASTAPGSRR